MKIFKTCLVAVVAAAVVATGSLASATLLSNGGFESPIDALDAPGIGNWGPFTGDANSSSTNSSVMPASGSQHLDASMIGDDASFTGVQQRISGIVTGEEYEFGFLAKRVGDLGIGAEFRIEWIDANDQFVGGQFDNNVAIEGSLTTDYQPYSQTRTAPAGAVELRAVFAVQSFGPGDNNGTVFVDDAFVNGLQVPEPTSIALMGLAGLAITSMRRRK